MFDDSWTVDMVMQWLQCLDQFFSPDSMSDLWSPSQQSGIKTAGNSQFPHIPAELRIEPKQLRSDSNSLEKYTGVRSQVRSTWLPNKGMIVRWCTDEEPHFMDPLIERANQSVQLFYCSIVQTGQRLERSYEWTLLRHSLLCALSFVSYSAVDFPGVSGSQFYSAQELIWVQLTFLVWASALPGWTAHYDCDWTLRWRL